MALASFVPLIGQPRLGEAVDSGSSGSAQNDRQNNRIPFRFLVATISTLGYAGIVLLMAN